MDEDDPPEVKHAHLSWGIRPSSSLSFGTSTVYKCIPLNSFEYVVLATNKIALVDRHTIKSTAPLNLSCAVYISRLEIICGVIATTSSFVFLRPYDLPHPIHTDFRTQQIPTYHIICSRRHTTLVTVGDNIRIWDFICRLPARLSISVRPTISITARATLPFTFESDLVNPPGYDYEWDRVFVPTSGGFVSLTLDGSGARHASKLPSSARTVAAYDGDRHCLVTADPVEGVCEWTINGTFSRRYYVGQSSVLCLRILNRSFVVYVDTKLNTFILDIATSRLFQCGVLRDKPMSVDLADDRLIVGVNSWVDFYDVVVPCTLWARNISRPSLILCCPRPECAARVVILTDNSFANFLSPRTGLHVTTASTTNGFPIANVLYERTPHLDQLFVVQEDGSVSLFSTGEFPCEFIRRWELNAATVMPVLYLEELSYCVATISGELLICNYASFAPVKRFLVQSGRMRRAHYDAVYRTILMMYDEQIVRYDIKKGTAR
jgi:hypothetical protein